MKYIFFAVLVLPFLGEAQTAPACKLINAVDPYTKEKTLSTGFVQLVGASFNIDANKQEIDILFTISGADKCYTDASMAAIFFAGTKLKLSQRNNGAMNCEGIFRFTLRNTSSAPTLLRKFATQKIDKIIFTGNNKKESVVTLNPEQQQLVLDLSACMMNEGPLLLKQ